jgi:hypothetical protein
MMFAFSNVFFFLMCLTQYPNEFHGMFFVMGLSDPSAMQEADLYPVAQENFGKWNAALASKDYAKVSSSIEPLSPFFPLSHPFVL